MSHNRKPSWGVAYVPSGVVFSYDPTSANHATASRVTLKHGRLTVDQAPACEPDLSEYFRNRHVQSMRIVPGPPRLRIELSDVSIDLFEGLGLEELERIERTIDTELRNHQSRKLSAMASDPLPDRWRYVRSVHRSWEESKALLILAALCLSVLGTLVSAEEAWKLFSAMDGLPLEPDVKLELVGWLCAGFTMFALAARMALASCRCCENPNPNGARVWRWEER